jgi:hypothetical protein
MREVAKRPFAGLPSEQSRVEVRRACDIVRQHLDPPHRSGSFLAFGAAAPVGFPQSDDALVWVDDSGHAGRAGYVEWFVTSTSAETLGLRDGFVESRHGNVRNPTLPSVPNRPQPRNDLPFDLE